MIISGRITEIYDSLSPGLNLLMKDIDPILLELSKKFDGFYTSRVKPKESFSQKLETGRYKDPNQIIDLFAATIVVATYNEVSLVEKEIEKTFKILKTKKNREKAPWDFIYDDLHLYIEYVPKVIVPGKEYLQRPFELQLKTFLQHGWTKATHDIIYKGAQISWQRFRIAHQIKAMLEQSDQILVQIDKTADICPDNSFKDFSEMNILMKLVEENWPSTLLPFNLRGLVDNILKLLKICSITSSSLKEEVDSKRYVSLLSAKSLTPYQAILGIIIKKDSESLYRGIKGKNGKIYISKELKDIIGINIPEELIALSLNL